MRALVIPAAGRGSRLGHTLPKALVPVAGVPMIVRLIEMYRPLVDHVAIVVAPGTLPRFRRLLEPSGLDIGLHIQEEPTGMLDAVLIPAGDLQATGPDEVWVTWCDQVAVRESTRARLARVAASDPGAALVLPTVRRERPYIHFVRDASDRIVDVLQRREGDAMPEVGESDIGLFALGGRAYLELLPEFAREAEMSSGSGERNFLPFIPWLAARERVLTVHATDAIESIGVNTPEERRRIAEHLRRGAT